MAEGLSVAQANAYLNSLCRGTAYTPPAGVFVKLHVAAPGAAGTANPAGNTTRVAATFGTAAAGGAISNTAAIDWTSVSTAEDYTHFTAWDASTAGNFLFSGTITANAVAVGDNFSIPIGDCDVTLAVAS
jgi:hypothetical protein